MSRPLSDFDAKELIKVVREAVREAVNEERAVRGLKPSSGPKVRCWLSAPHASACWQGAMTLPEARAVPLCLAGHAGCAAGAFVELLPHAAVLC